jgi:hypothetical protein
MPDTQSQDKPLTWKRSNTYLFLSQPSGYHIAVIRLMETLQYESYATNSEPSSKQNETNYQFLGMYTDPQEARNACDEHSTLAIAAGHR